MCTCEFIEESISEVPASFGKLQKIYYTMKFVCQKSTSRTCTVAKYFSKFRTQVP
jgi:hypothetical protein